MVHARTISTPNRTDFRDNGPEFGSCQEIETRSIRDARQDVSKTNGEIGTPLPITNDKLLLMVEELRIELMYAKAISNHLALHTVEYCLDVSLYEIALLSRNYTVVGHC